MKDKLLLISDSRELYWFCLRKFSGRCEVIHSDFKSYKKILRLEGPVSVSSVLLDTAFLTPSVLCQVRDFIAENSDCLFLTCDSSENFFQLELKNIFSPYSIDKSQEEEKFFFVESPPALFKLPQKKTYMLQLEKFARHEEPVLLLGESGSGKSHAAEIIHLNSSRKGKPFVRRNIAELNPALIESELFGCVKGAYTDAVERKGLFELAEDGTLFIDEIGELSLENQAKLLGVLDTGKFCRVGSSKEIKIKCRLVFATDADLQARVKEHTFKKQLYWRLAKFVVNIPPLRERRDEIIPLALEFAAENKKELSEDALAYLKSLEWPGNIRQLSFCIERSAVLCENKILFRKDLVL